MLEELEELIEPLDVPAPPLALAVDAVVAGPASDKFQVLGLLKTEAGTHLYEAADGAYQKVWLREAFNESGAAALALTAQVLREADTPLLPRLLQEFEGNGKKYLATEAAEGPFLAEALADPGWTFVHSLSALAQVAVALGRLHTLGWAHLGLRPSCIALGQPGKPVKIADFTYATRLGQAPAAPFFHAGTSAPELLTGEPVDARADIYSLGALLFHAATGAPIPETGAELNGVTVRVPGLPQILHRCLGPREARYAAMEELHAALLGLTRRLAPTVSYSAAAMTTIGLEPSRVTNQDAYAYLSGRVACETGGAAWAVACVADGMGGMEAGEVAAEVAVQTVTAQAATLAVEPPQNAEEQTQAVKSWAHAANERVCEALQARGARGGATLLCVCLIDRCLTVAHIGDCRLYLVRGGAVQLLTRDHSLAMALALQGEITMDAVRTHPDRSKVTRSLGDRQPLPDYFVDTLETVAGAVKMELQSGDVLLLCSDGLWEPVLECDMAEAVTRHAPDLNAAAAALRQLVLERGAPDNATLVLLRIDEF